MSIIDSLDEFTKRQGIISAEWCRLLDRVEEEIDKLKEENQMMREGLSWYGDTEKYRRPDRDRNGMGGMSSQTDFEIEDGEWKMLNSEKEHYCYGKKARMILKKIDKNKKGEK